MLQQNKTPEPEGNYLHWGIRETDLFTLTHLNSVAEMLANPNKNVDGICFMIGSGVEYGKYYKVYVPFFHDGPPLTNFEDVQRTVRNTIVEMMHQLKGQMTLH